ncbi:DUF2254 domain-containing protein [Rhodocyclaceae bacterium SMB388]
MLDHLSFVIKQFHERLWVRPLIVCVLSIAAVFLADLMDMTELDRFLPDISKESTETLLKIIASSMLMMATFAVTSMVSAYASASQSATPRSFSLMIADDVSQNALSVFIGAFIYSVVALIALMNGAYGGPGSRFILFSLTIGVLAIVILAFIRWVDKIARLGRLGDTIDKVEAIAGKAVRKRQSAPRLGGVAASSPPDRGRAVFGQAIGYVGYVDTAALQKRAVESQLRIVVAALPGTFCTPNRPVAWVIREASDSVSDEDAEAIAAAFDIGGSRVFEQDPRFGLVVLSEIASHALSPAVNDPGTAIAVTGAFVRLFVTWNECGKAGDVSVQFDRVAVPELSMADMFDDAFTGIARDGAGTIEVVLRLLKAFEALAAAGDATMRGNALRHARLALVRAEIALKAPQDLAAARQAAKFAM